MSAWTVGVLTVSDRCHKGESEDRSGPVIMQVLRDGFSKERKAPSFITAVVPDEVDEIQGQLRRMQETCALVVTTGGTGFAVRDVTPEAVKPMLTKEAPGLIHAMFAYGLTQTPVAWLSRAVAGVADKTVVITLPGSPKAVKECLTPIVGNGLEHAMELASGNAQSVHPVGGDGAAADTTAAPYPATSGCTGACGRGGSGTKERKTLVAPGGTNVTERDRKSGFAMVPMAEALQLIAEHTPGATAIEVDTVAAAGLTLAEDVVATFPQPPFRASIKDGYAVIAADGPGDYEVVGSLCAGATLPEGFVLAPGTVVRVNTGGPLPPGSDAVVQVEDTELLETKDAPDADGGKEEARIRVSATVAAGHDIRPIGCDMQPGGIAVKAGATMNAPEIGLALSVGARKVRVMQKPRVAVISTGDELSDTITSTGAPPPGKIYDSNRGMLIAAAQPYARTVVDGGIANDNMADTRRVLEAAFDAADIIISTGGVSMGEVDCVKRCLLEMGADVHFGRVNMKPGKPTTFATLKGKVFFALPGNPVSAMVCFHVFTTPSLLKLSGARRLSLPTVQATLNHEVRLDRERPEYHRCYVSYDMVVGGFSCKSTGIQASHRLLSLAGANGLMVLPSATEGQTSVAAGSKVKVMMIGPTQN